MPGKHPLPAGHPAVRERRDNTGGRADDAREDIGDPVGIFPRDPDREERGI